MWPLAGVAHVGEGLLDKWVRFEGDPQGGYGAVPILDVGRLRIDDEGSATSPCKSSAVLRSIRLRCHQQDANTKKDCGCNFSAYGVVG